MARTLSTEARTKILDATQALLVEQGFEGFTVDAVAHRSGVAKSTIYRHFATGHELLIAGLDCMIEPLPTPNTGSLIADLLQIFGDRLHLVNEPQLRAVLFGILDATGRDPDLKRVHDELKEQRTLPIRTVVELAMGRGEISRDINIDHAIDLIEGPLFLHVFVRQLPLTHDDLGGIIELAVNGLRATGRD